MSRTLFPFKTRDVVYHRPAGIDLLARLYVPERTGPLPAVVDVHGGRWCAETRLTNQVIDQALAASGIFVMALDFRMPPVARFPLPVADINFAIRWLKYHAMEFGLETNWIGSVGTSSGGHQVLLNALTPHDPKFAADQEPSFHHVDPSLAYVIACWPVSDPVARYRYAKANLMSLHIDSHDAYWVDEAQMAEGSPQRLVDEGLAETTPPLLLVQGGADIVLSPEMSEIFADSYRSAGGTVDLQIFDGEPHTFITKAPNAPNSLRAISMMANFIHSRTDQASTGEPEYG